MTTDPTYYINGVLAGNRRTLAKTVTLLESHLPEHRHCASQVLAALQPKSGGAIRLGITGVPGAGKSTFIEALGLQLLEQGNKVAVLAVDPSSRRSGGSILGDKTRMEGLAVHPDAFVRPSPAGRTLGGVAAASRELILLCEAAGFDVILVETVGVGQSETAVATMVDFFLVLLITGAGDELQGIKKGLLEMADGLLINKADGSNRERAAKARQEMEAALRIMLPPSSNWQPPVLTCSSLEGQGVSEVWQMVLRHRHTMQESGELARRRHEQDVEWMWSLVHQELRRRFEENTSVQDRLEVISSQVSKGTLSPLQAAEELLTAAEMGRTAENE